jgi:hypothetical protein
LADDEVIEHMQRVDGRDRREIRIPLAACQLCTSQCNDICRDAFFARAENDEAMKAFRDWFGTISDRRRMTLEGLSPNAAWNRIACLCSDAVAEEGLSSHVDAAWCWFAHAWVRCAESYSRQANGDPASVTLGAVHRQAFVTAYRDLAEAGTEKRDLK